ncbi:MAG: beta-galactosidase [Bacteroidetes bacterium GWD2_45_23]|nr:MAG: beta-galactosidase [Bacteroidetes bacterium GWC2_46_850]OFX84108.1 MAG: beta-galactosidase [Bacteroidetes bacterium GWD2_45_23]
MLISKSRLIFIILGGSLILSCAPQRRGDAIVREQTLINEDWSFFRYDSPEKTDNLIYDIRPEITEAGEYLVADAKPTEAVEAAVSTEVLKPWILPTANPFIADPANRSIRPEGEAPGKDFPFVQHDFDDTGWEKVNLPHDWAIKGPFYAGNNPVVGGGMGRLPVQGVAWYRKGIAIPATDEGRSIFLDVEGAMSYAMVWLNGTLVGGWPYGYNSWRLDLTPYIRYGEENQLAIRIDNPNHSSRWYPGAGIYRNIWLTKTNAVHIGQWGTYVTASDISDSAATLNLEVGVDNNAQTEVSIGIETEIFELNEQGALSGKAVARSRVGEMVLDAGASGKEKYAVVLKKPRLWGPKPHQTPHLYKAVTRLTREGKVIDHDETTFGIRDLQLDPQQGVLVNGEPIKLQGVNQHHDLGALGAAFNRRAAERQLALLQEMGCNAIRMAHNPPAPELLELTDKMGFLVVNEIFDSWERKKTPHDFHLIFPEWAEADTRSFVRRDRNHPSVIMWSYGNEVGEQYTDEEGASVAAWLNGIIKEEDPTRPTTLSMNYAKPDMPFPRVVDVIGLNYQGEGIRQEPEFEGTDRIRTVPQYDLFQAAYPEKVIFGSEVASSFSSRGIYLFPVTQKITSPVRDGQGGDSRKAQVSAYELYAVDFGSSPDKVFMMQDKHPFVAGGFVWTGWDHLGEPTPYYSARSSYCGIIDLAGFKKDRFYLYQSRWRPELPMIHILPHWNWRGREGEVTPVHLFTSGDEAELFLNGRSLGRKQKAAFEYRLRWDDIRYEPGELKAIAYKNGKKWAEEVVVTTGEPFTLQLEADRSRIAADGSDLAFITVQVTDRNGLLVPDAVHPVHYTIEGPGEIVATDNGNPADMIPFHSSSRNAFSGQCLVIVRGEAGKPGRITIKADSPGLKENKFILESE